MTDEERSELAKLTQDDLIELLATEREARARAETRFAAERKEVIDKFLRGESRVNDEEDEDDDLSKNKAFQRLKKRIY